MFQSPIYRVTFTFACGFAVFLAAATAFCDEPPRELHGLPLLLDESFTDGADRWEPTDPECWRIEDAGGEHGMVFSQYKKNGAYQPPHRSPFNIALLKDVSAGDLVLTARVKSTIADYGHRDACLVFGHQDAAHFYYVHFGKQADDHANQVFIVADSPRTKISTTSTDGTPWDDEWHLVKLIRRVKEGSIEVYFDDMDKPVMTAKNDEFQHGRIGIGTFDDTNQWDDVRLYAKKEEKQ